MSTDRKFELPADPGNLLARLLDVLEHEIAPLTSAGVSQGNKLFGAAILKKSDLSTVIAETNNETDNPLWHGEVHCLKKFYEMQGHPPTGDLIFLATHEPCSLCLSAITWAGFDNFFYLFSHKDSRDSFSIPHDLRILSEVFGLQDGEYRRRNAYWSSWGIKDEIARLDAPLRAQFQGRIARIDEIYNGFSDTYQGGKSDTDIPLS